MYLDFHIFYLHRCALLCAAPSHKISVNYMEVWGCDVTKIEHFWKLVALHLLHTRVWVTGRLTECPGVVCVAPWTRIEWVSRTKRHWLVQVSVPGSAAGSGSKGWNAADLLLQPSHSCPATTVPDTHAIQQKNKEGKRPVRLETPVNTRKDGQSYLTF